MSRIDPLVSALTEAGLCPEGHWFIRLRERRGHST